MFQEGIEEHKIHKKDTDLEVLSSSPRRTEEETKELGTQSDEQDTLELEDEGSLEFSTPLCIQECESHIFEYFQGMTKTDMEVDNVDNQGMKHYIEEC